MLELSGDDLPFEEMRREKGRKSERKGERPEQEGTSDSVISQIQE
jgi:hypothetical protein